MHATVEELCDDAGVANPVAALLVALESERLPARHIFVEMILVAAANVMQPKFNNWRYAGAGPDDDGGEELSRLQVHHTSFTRYTLEDSIMLPSLHTSRSKPPAPSSGSG
jgi:hypothetical protein